jgi:hypothetical protein
MKKDRYEILDSIDMTLEVLVTELRNMARELKRMNDYNENFKEKLQNTETVNIGFKRASELMDEELH